MAKTINWEHKEPKRSTGDNLRRTLKDKDAMLEVAKLAAEDQRKAMTHNTREVEEIRACLTYEISTNNGNALVAEPSPITIQKVQDFLHHQLQKARHDGYNAGLADGTDKPLLAIEQMLQKARENTLREVIEIVESVQLTATRQHANDTTPEKAKVVNEWLMPEVKRNIIEAIHSELDQDKKDDWNEDMEHMHGLAELDQDNNTQV